MMRDKIIELLRAPVRNEDIADAILALTQERIAELERVQGVLVGALKDARHALQFANDTPNGPIHDTIWMMDGPETLFDFMDAALAAVQKPANCIACENGQYATTDGSHCYMFREKPEGPCAKYKEVKAYAAQQPDSDRYFAPEYEVWQDGTAVASSSGHRPDAIREILHYAAQYQQDGPVRIFEVQRNLCSPEELTFALNATQPPEIADNETD